VDALGHPRLGPPGERQTGVHLLQRRPADGQRPRLAERLGRQGEQDTPLDPPDRYVGRLDVEHPVDAHPRIEGGLLRAAVLGHEQVDVHPGVHQVLHVGPDPGGQLVAEGEDDDAGPGHRVGWRAHDDNS
jgi:hypothetical protein